MMSKPLGHPDESGFQFIQEMLAGEPTYSINFDRLQFDAIDGRYVIFELLLCDEKQAERGVTPFTSHPNRYWFKNKAKFLSLWKAARALNARMYLVNYARLGTKSADEVLLIEALDMDESGITKENQIKFDRASFGEWFREQNKRCTQ